MDINQSTILTLLFDSITELNEQLAPEQQLRPAPETQLLGADGTLDSLAFVNFVSIVEEKIQQRLGLAIVLNGDQLSPASRDPFSTVATLAEYIELAANGNVAAWK